MSRKYKVGDILELKKVPPSFRHVFITAIKNGRYYLYWLSKPDEPHWYHWSEIENDNVCFKISR